MKQLGRVLLPTLLLAAYFATTPNAQAVSSGVVISGIYPGGGQLSATYTNDYVELYNLSASAIDVTGWRVQYRNNGVAFTATDPTDAVLSGPVPAHGYFLVGEASGGANGAALPTQDATGTANLDVNSGKVRLIDPAVVDLVGYGFADESETSPANGALQTSTALERKDAGCAETDNNQTDFEYVQPAVAHNSADTHTCTPNAAPVLAPIGNKSATTGHELSFTVTATDSDNDPLTFSASNLPSGANFDDADTHQFTWIPPDGSEGSYPNVHFAVSDDRGHTDFEDITITVTTGVNQPPVLDPIGNKSGHTDHAIGFAVTGSDPDGDPLTFSASNLPSGATFDTDETHAFSWTPTAGDIGTYPNVHFEVTDGRATDSEDITITVVANQPPVLDPIGAKQAHTDHPLTFVVTGSDPDSDPLTFSASNLPSGANFDTGTRTFSWTPVTADIGAHPNVHFEVSDGAATDTEDITITVVANSAPVLDPIGDKTGRSGHKITFVVTGSDPDADPLTFTATNLPRGARFNPATHRFSWTPKASQRGGGAGVTFTVSDGALTDSETVRFVIRAR